MLTANPSPHSKPCDLCKTPRDVLLRCQIDESGKWYLVCTSKCWKDVSGGVVDGDAAHPHYRYGGMWKNKHDAVSAKRKRGKKGKNAGDGQVPEWQPPDVDRGDAGSGHAGELDNGSSTDGTASAEENDEDAEEQQEPLRDPPNLSSKKYTRNDIVQHKGVRYMCRKSHWQSDSRPPNEDIHLWKEIGSLQE